MLVSSLFPPSVFAGTHRALALARHGPAAGWDVTVVTGPEAPSTEAGAYLARLVPAEVRVERHREPPLTPGRLFPRIDESLVDALAMFETGRRAAAGARPAVVLATGPSFHAFAAALLLARALGSTLVLEYRDEWTECPFDFVTHGRFNRWWERRCLRAAAAVVFTTASQRDHQLRVFPELDAARCHVIPNGWDGDEAAPAACPDGVADGRPVTVSYVGALGSWTPPTAFLAALRAVVERRPDLARRLKVKFVGPKAREELRELEAFPHRDVLDVVDLVPKPAASAIMRDSAALLLLNDNADMARYIPSKLYEYIGAGRPVLLFADGGESGALVRELGAGVVVPSGDPGGLEAALESIARGEAGAGPPGAIDAWRRRHTREQLARETFHLLERVAGGAASPCHRVGSGGACS
jgi:glycosyltransferase involved in cell wall biosynthesis